MLRKYLRRPKTVEEALEDTQTLWKEMGRTGGGKVSTANMLGMFNYYSQCPLCQYVINNHGDVLCAFCPLADMWNDKERLILAFEEEFDIKGYMEDAKEEQKESGDYLCPCEQYNSPYYWHFGSKQVRMIAANLIADMAKEKLDSLKPQE